MDLGVGSRGRVLGAVVGARDRVKDPVPDTEDLVLVIGADLDLVRSDHDPKSGGENHHLGAEAAHAVVTDLVQDHDDLALVDPGLGRKTGRRDLRAAGVVRVHGASVRNQKLDALVPNQNLAHPSPSTLKSRGIRTRNAVARINRTTEKREITQ